MLYLKHLSAVTQHELQAVGYRAQDIALLAQNQIPNPPSVVVLSNAFDEVMRIGNLKYKIDYLLSHAQLLVEQSLVNVYTGVRKALYDAKLPSGFETELKEMYDQITKPVSIGELVAESERPPVRVILSTNRLDDPEDNSTIIQAVNGFDELMLAVREGWALSYAPALLKARLKEHYPESKLKVSLVIQVMDRRAATCHAYSCLPQDHQKIYLQAYLGYPDLRERIPKDYIAIGKWSLKILASDIATQAEILELDAKKEIVATKLEQPLSMEKMVDRDLLEISRLTRKAERLLMTPIKAFFASTGEDHELLWVNRLGFDTMIIPEGDGASIPPPALPPIAPTPSAAPIVPVSAQSSDDFLLQEVKTESIVEPVTETTVEPVTMPKTELSSAPSAQQSDTISAKLLTSSLVIVRQIVERKYRATFGETPTENIADAINRLNTANVFSRAVDGAVLLQADEAVKRVSNLSAVEYAKAVGEVAFLMGYA